MKSIDHPLQRRLITQFAASFVVDRPTNAHRHVKRGLAFNAFTHRLEYRRDQRSQAKIALKDREPRRSLIAEQALDAHEQAPFETSVFHGRAINRATARREWRSAAGANRRVPFAFFADDFGDELDRPASVVSDIGQNCAFACEHLKAPVKISCGRHDLALFVECDLTNAGLVAHRRRRVGGAEIYANAKCHDASCRIEASAGLARRLDQRSAVVQRMNVLIVHIKPVLAHLPVVLAQVRREAAYLALRR